MTTYKLTLTEDGCSLDIHLDATTAEEAIAEALDCVEREAEDWCSFGEYGDDGASVKIGWCVTDPYGDEIASDNVTVDIPPNHESLIEETVRWDRPDNFCGLSPDDHDWTSEGEGGCDENPGVWSTGGTSMMFRSHCRVCGLRRTDYHTGSQRNPGEHDTTEYEMPAAE